MNSAEQKYKNHLGILHSFKIGEDTFNMKPLGGKHLAKFMQVVSKMSSLKPGASQEDMLNAFTEETVTDLIELMTVCIKQADSEVSDDVIKEFINANFWDIFPEFAQINGMKDSKVEKTNAKIQELIKQREDTNGTGDQGIPSKG